MIDVGRQINTDLLIRPPGVAWPSSLSARPASEEARRFRAELGLPVDRPIVMTGHQAAFWHPGILAKYLALDAAAAHLKAACVWLTVDQDHNDPWAIRYPVKVSKNADNGSTLATRVWRIDGRQPGEAADVRELDVPTSRIASIDPTPLPKLESSESFAGPHVKEGMTAIRDRLRAHRAAPNAAEQVARATGELLAPFLQSTAAKLLATSIARTSLFIEIVERMKGDPSACVSSYNAAAARHPHARIAPLPVRCNADSKATDAELPLWHIGPAAGSGRKRVCASMLAKIPTHELAPRALLMTGLLRWAGCDLFVHGTGGGGGVGGVGGAGDIDGGYDRITEEWLREWLGVELGPIAVVTATLRLNIDVEQITPERIAVAQWKAHHAAHDPALLGDAAAAARKLAMVEEIRTARAHGGDPLTPYRRMHTLLEETRRALAPRLESLRSEAASAAERKSDAAVLADREWAFPLYEPTQIDGLRTKIADEFNHA